MMSDAHTLSVVLERINGAWMTLDAILVGYMLYYLNAVRKTFKISFSAWLHQKLPLYVQAAIAIVVFHAGDLGVRALIWMLRHGLNNGAPTVQYNLTSFPLIVFSMVAGLGILCMLRIFSAPWLGAWLWLTGGVVGFTVAFLTRSLPF